jgi:hypothetical protein
MSDNNFLKLNNVDLEDGLNNDKQEILNNDKQEILNNATTTTRTTTKTSTSISMSSNDTKVSCCIKSFAWVITMIIAFPLTFCDLYYGYNDKSCVSEPAGKLAINLKDYLLISGWINVILLTIVTFGLCFIDLKTITNFIKNPFAMCCGVFSIILWLSFNYIILC